MSALRRLMGIASLLLAATAAHADTVRIVCDRDNTLYETLDGSLSNGAGPGLFAGENASSQTRRALVHFDVAAAIPAGATINSAVLVMHISRETTGSQPLNVHLVLADWGEGTSIAVGGGGGGGAGGPSTTNDATWIHRFYPTVTWSTPGGEFDGIASTTTSASDTGYVQWPSTPDAVANVKSWLDQPANNFGWLIKGGPNFHSAFRLDSREVVSPWYRPTLQVDYTPSLIGAEPIARGASLRVVGAHPSPSGVVFELSLPQASAAEIEIVDARGTRVRLLDAGDEAGARRIVWDGRDEGGAATPSGVYFARVVGEPRLNVRFVRVR